MHDKSLKTLKDIESYTCSTRYMCVDADDLRRVAREWIERMDTEINFPIKQTGYSLDDLESWVRHFFNLEDEKDE